MAATENHKAIKELMEGYELVCITASVSGGTGLSVSIAITELAKPVIYLYLPLQLYRSAWKSPELT